MIKCVNCDKQLTTKKKTAKFCSLSCSTKYSRLRILQKDMPPNHKRCGRCMSVKNFDEFRKNKNSAFGYSYFCKECDKQRIYTRDKRKVLLNAAKKRAKDQNLEFNLDINDIILPMKCPILGIELVFNKHNACDNSYSIDRIEPNQGYIKGNIQIISFKANTIKNNASLSEIEKVYLYMKQYQQRKSE